MGDLLGITDVKHLAPMTWHRLGVLQKTRTFILLETHTPLAQESEKLMGIQGKKQFQVWSLTQFNR